MINFETLKQKLKALRELVLNNKTRIDELESKSETDPTVPQHVKNITQEDINKWNRAPVQSLPPSGNGSIGTSDYDQLFNKPKINNVELNGNVTTEELGIINFSGNYEDLENKPVIPSINGLASEEWVESKGYLTEHQDISEITRKINEVYEDYLSASEVIG